MDLYAQLLLNALQIGTVYVLFALGLTLIFGIMKIVNFAHGAFFTAAALTVSVVMPWAMTELGAPVWLAYLLGSSAAIALVCVLGAVIYLVGFQRYLQDLIGSFILSIGILLLLNGIYLWIFGGAPRTVPPLVTGNITIFGASMMGQRLVVMILAALITLGVWLLIQKTKLGLSLRAAAEDHEAAMLQGIGFRRVALYGFLIGSVLAACAGALMAPLHAITTVGGDDFLVKAFIIIIVGGLGSVSGAIIAGFLVALIESIGGHYFDLSTATIAMFALVMVLLLVRPQGIMGRAER
ncbi:MAG: branched-chain amino acid ABC transporter permease [Burkholderiaceae bacterium]